MLRDEVEHAVAPGAVRAAAVVEVEHDDALGAGRRPDEPVVPGGRGLELPPDPVRARRRVLEAVLRHRDLRVRPQGEHGEALLDLLDRGGHDRLRSGHHG